VGCVKHMLYKQLTNAGLTEKEAKVYLAVLELGEASIVRIVKKTGIKRSTVYEMLELLKEKVLISVTKRKNRRFYIAEDPRKLEKQLDERKKVVIEIMPELLSYMNLIDRKPKIRYFENIEGIREVFRDTLEYPDQEIITWYPAPYINLGKDFFEKFYYPQRLKKKIWVRAIVPDTEVMRQANAKPEALFKVKYVADPAFKFFQNEIKVYGNAKVGIMSYDEGIGLIIESKKIHDSLKALFEVMWNSLV
jgi:HTH-type transcriptional regulator, sugar sensing transcriptional regulator